MAVNGIPFLLYSTGSGSVAPPPPPPNAITEVTWPGAYLRKGKHDDETIEERRLRVFAEIEAALEASIENKTPQPKSVARKAVKAIGKTEDAERLELIALLTRIQTIESENEKLTAQRVALEGVRRIQAELRDEEDAILAILMSFA